MDEVSQNYKRAFEIYQADPVPWIVLYGALIAISLVTMGLGVCLAPNVIRATRRALREQDSPRLDELFVFDRIMEDAIASFGMLVVVMISGSIVGPLSTLAGILLSLAPPLVTEDEVGGIDALQLSVNYVLKEPVPVIAHGLIGTALNLPGLCCLFPIFLTLPPTGIAHSMLYEQHRARILQLPDAKQDEQD